MSEYTASYCTYEIMGEQSLRTHRLVLLDIVSKGSKDSSGAHSLGCGREDALQTH